VAATAFRWKASETGGSSTLFLLCDWRSADPTTATKDPIFVSYTIETPGTEFTLPAIPDVGIRPGASCWWWVRWCATANPTDEQRCALSGERAAVKP
jgi:hypothetical protein